MNALEFRVGLHVSDYQKALAFYRGTLEMPILFEWDTPQGKGIVLDAGRGGEIELIARSGSAKSETQPSGLTLSLRVADAEAVDGWYQKLSQAGVTILETPTERTWKHYSLVFSDPDGVPIHLYAEI